jgi:hypothetical protein
MLDPAETIKKRIEYLVSDFETAWTSVAALPKSESITPGRGNFMFGMLSMVLLEVACRACKQCGAELMHELSNALKHRDHRYFIKNLDMGNRVKKDFDLPSLGPDKKNLISFLFDFIRNGQSHAYYSLKTELSDGSYLRIGLTGAINGRLITEVSDEERSTRHLVMSQQHNDTFNVRTDILYMDIREAIRAAGIHNLDSELIPFKRSSKLTLAEFKEVIFAGQQTQ